MAKHFPTPQDSRHLYIVAGYPASGKSSSLWKSAKTGFPLFGGGHAGVVPSFETLHDVRENSSTAAKLKAGFWVTLGDMPTLNQQSTLPQKLILHLDLLLAHLFYRTPNISIAGTAEAEAEFGRLFAQPALQSYAKCTVVTLHAPLEEIQRRWRHRYPDGPPSGCSNVLAEKHRLIMDGENSATLFAAIHASWHRHLATLARSGKLAGHLHAQTKLRADASHQAQAGPSAGCLAAKATIRPGQGRAANP